MNVFVWKKIFQIFYFVILNVCVFVDSLIQLQISMIHNKSHSHHHSTTTKLYTISLVLDPKTEKQVAKLYWANWTKGVFRIKFEFDLVRP